MSLCFLEAFQKKDSRKISYEEYLDHLLAHCIGVRHPQDKDWSDFDGLLKGDPFAHSIRVWSLLMNPVTDATPFKNILLAYHTGNDDAVKAQLDGLSDEHTKYLRESLAVAASEDNRPKILKLSLDKGFTYRHYWIQHADRVQNAGEVPEISAVLDECRYRKLYPRYIPRNDVNRHHGTEEERNRPPKVNPDGSFHDDQIGEWQRDIPW